MHSKIIENNYIYISPFYTPPEEIISKIDIDEEKINSLTQKELKILRLIVNGLSSKSISNEQKISIRTVETHRSNIMKKLEINKLVDLVKFSVKNGIV